MIEFPTGFDCETTGIDLWHGCKPFLFCAWDLAIEKEEDQPYWEWDVDPYTREPNIPLQDLLSLERFTVEQNLVYHNRKFEQRACATIALELPRWEDEDTLIASHTVRSIGKHNLKDLALQYCDITPEDRDAMRDAINECRRYGRSVGWRIANEGDPHFPAWKPKKKKHEEESGWWVADMWLPRAVAKARDLPEDHPYWHVTRHYCSMDAKRTAMLWLVMYEALLAEGLVEQYEERKKLIETTYYMERRGITISKEAVEASRLKFGFVAETSQAKCITLARGGIENLRSPKQLQKVMYEDLKLPKRKATKTGFSTDKAQIEEFLRECRPQSRAYHFLSALLAYRQNSKGVDTLESYERYSSPISPGYVAHLDLRYDEDHLYLPTTSDFANIEDHVLERYFLLNPNFNITGTGTVRGSSSDPNEQNVSKKENFNLREVCCPLPGREWYSMDYSNIEMRIFAYRSGDQQLIDAFERGEKVHLIFARILHPEKMEYCDKNGLDFSQVYESSWYQWIKNGNFALIYGAQKARADATYHVPGAYEKIRAHLPLISQLMDHFDREARTKGYVTTMGGYRLFVPKNKPHAAVNYYIQGSAGWYLTLAMNRIHAYLKNLADHYMIMSVHDELDFDVPIQSDFNVIRDLADIMEQSGIDLGIPVPVEVERHSTSWAEGVKLNKAYKGWRDNPYIIST